LYLRFIREFKDTNPKEFKRIQKFPLKARTARSNKNAPKKEAKNNTLVFLKSPYKMDFYKVNKKNEVESLSFIEAAELFEAKATEQGFNLPSNHYDNVQAALKEFDKDFLGSTTETTTTNDKADAISAQAKKFLRDFKGITRKPDAKKASD